MQRTIATTLLLAWGAVTAAVAAADQSQAMSAWQQQAARIHIGDDDEDTPAWAAASLHGASYYDETAAAGSVLAASTSYASASTGSSGAFSSVAPGCGNVCNFCNDNYCTAARVEYLLWWTRGRNTPPLVTTSPPGTDGVLPGAEILFGADPIGTDIRSGGRVTLSHLLADECTWVDARFWGLEDGSETFFHASDGDPLLARPFFNALLGVQDSFLIAAPGVANNGSISVLAKNDLIAADVWGRRTWYQDCDLRIDALAGYMFTRLDDSININSSEVSIDATSAFPVGTTIRIHDTFGTQNEFHGGQVGILATTRRSDNLSLEVLGKVALGNMREQVFIGGTTSTVLPGGAPVTTTTGLFAQPSNSGTFQHNQLAYVPEVNINGIYQVNPCWKVMVGYTFVYWSHVVLAGNQIDTNINQSQPNLGPPFPRLLFQRSDFWAQGLSFGAQYQW